MYTCDFCVVDNNTVTVDIGEIVTVKENVKISIDCSKLIQFIISIGYTPVVTWYRDSLEITNGSNIVISKDNTLCIVLNTRLSVGGQLGTAGLYTCEVCNNGSDTECVSNNSRHIVCGE